MKNKENKPEKKVVTQVVTNENKAEKAFFKEINLQITKYLVQIGKTPVMENQKFDLTISELEEMLNFIVKEK
jgi:hypothetical protein